MLAAKFLSQSRVDYRHSTLRDRAVGCVDYLITVVIVIVLRIRVTTGKGRGP